MELDQKVKYLGAIATSLALAMGQRNDDYNKSGIGLRDYWKMNGLRSPLQMVDMKMKRALSQIGSWQLVNGHPSPTSAEQVAKLEESMVDLINYAAFVVCEAKSLYEDHVNVKQEVELQDSGLLFHLQNAVKAWQEE